MDISQPNGEITPADPVQAPATTLLVTGDATTPPSLNSSIPVTWADLNLRGRLIYSTVSSEADEFISNIKVLDLATGELSSVFTVNGNAWIYYLAVSPDENHLIMSYAPPSAPNAGSSTNLYSVQLQDGGIPQILFESPTISDRYIQVEWSPNGNYLYFVHYNFNERSSEEIYPHYEIFRMAYPDGEPKKILDQGFWPRISPDSSTIVYVFLDAVSGVNSLFIANADGSDPRRIEFSGSSAPEIIDAPIFSPDGKSIIFSAVSPLQSYQPNWPDRLMGVQIASAHNVPSDWWSVPVSGGAATRLTSIQTIKLFASISPDESRIASTGGEGIFVMNMNGTGLRQVVIDPTISSTVNWIR
jgi:Tol biopolymer transport system component